MLAQRPLSSSPQQLARARRSSPRCPAASASASGEDPAPARPRGFGSSAPAPPPPPPAAEQCPCGSGLGYAACCGALHAGGNAETAVAVMRARFSAYVKGGDALKYIVSSTHPRNADAQRGDTPDSSAAQLLKDTTATWKNFAFDKLTVVKEERGATVDEHWVTFRATYSEKGGDGVRFKPGRWREPKPTKTLAEKSRFLASEVDGQRKWLYISGIKLTPNGLGTYSLTEVAPPPPPAAVKASA